MIKQELSTKSTCYQETKNLKIILKMRGKFTQPDEGITFNIYYIYKIEV
jgi:hypothetical protein